MQFWFGGFSFDSGGVNGFYLNNILELDQETGNWSNVANLESSRSNHGVSATDLTDLWKYCV